MHLTPHSINKMNTKISEFYNFFERDGDAVYRVNPGVKTFNEFFAYVNDCKTVR